MYKRIIQGKKAVFFDLDGTVANTTFLWTRAVGTVLERIGNTWITDEHKFTPGEDFVSQWSRLITQFGIETEKDVKTLIKETHEEFLKLLKDSDLEATNGFWEFLYEIKNEKGLKAVLITNSPKEVALQTLTKIEAQMAFDLIIYGDEVSKPKPDPEIFKKALSALGLSPQEVLVFEDSLVGTEAARAADLETVVIWDERFPEARYKGKIFMFLPDFSPLPGNLDLTYREYVLGYIKVLDEKDKKLSESKASELGKDINSGE